MHRILISVAILHLLLPTLNAIYELQHVSYKDLKGVLEFQSNNVTTFSHLLFNEEINQIIIGARNNLYRLEIDSLKLLEHVTWSVGVAEANNCQTSGGTKEDCHNYIKVLLRNGTKMLVCGTYASKSSCTWRKIMNISEVIDDELPEQEAYPFWPLENAVSLFPSNGSDGLFMGNEFDGVGNGGLIRKSVGNSSVFTHPKESTWLNKPQFVGTFETETHVYFVFREFKTECTHENTKIIHSRIARVCKNDPGVSMNGYSLWTTFMKTRLSCYTSGDTPFYYDQVQSIVYDSQKETLYGIFTTPINGISGSAVCAFDLEVIEKSFDGKFQHQTSSRKMCLPQEERNHFGRKCNSNTSDHITTLASRMNLLMYKDAESKIRRPIYLAESERFTQIAIDVAPTKLNEQVTVLYVATTTRLIKKISISSKTQETPLIQVWGPLPSTILTMKFLKHTHCQRLYVGTETSIVSIPVGQCDTHTNCQACLRIHLLLLGMLFLSYFFLI